MVDNSQSRSFITIFVPFFIKDQNDHDQNLIDRWCLIETRLH